MGPEGSFYSEKSCVNQPENNTDTLQMAQSTFQKSKMGEYMKKFAVATSWPAPSEVNKIKKRPRRQGADDGKKVPQIC